MKVARHYTMHRLELLELEMRSLFKSDKVKQKGLAEFMCGVDKLK